MDNSSPQTGMSKYKKLLLYVVIFGLGIGVGNYLLKNSNQSKSEQIVTVTGNGTVEVPADQAVVYIKTSIISTNKEKAANDNNKLTQDFKKALLNLGIPSDAINVSTYVDSAGGNNYSYPVPTGSDSSTLVPAIYPLPSSNEYNANSSFTITLNDLQLAEKATAIVDEFQNVQLNGGISYVLKDPSKYESEAREKALLDARNQAENIARINNLKIGKVVSVTDQKSNSPTGAPGVPYYPMYVKAYAEYGEKIVRVSASYTVKYGLKDTLFPF